MNSKAHAFAGAIALLTIFTFWSTTIASKLFGSTDQIIMVKSNILWGMLILVPAMAGVGASGFSLGGKWKNKLVSAKKKRMKFIGANGILILVPSAFYLAFRAQAHDFGGWFNTVQAIELIAGAINITLLSLNMRDGIALSRRKRTAT